MPRIPGPESRPAMEEKRTIRSRMSFSRIIGSLYRRRSALVKAPSWGPDPPTGRAEGVGVNPLPARAPLRPSCRLHQEEGVGAQGGRRCTHRDTGSRAFWGAPLPGPERVPGSRSRGGPSGSMEHGMASPWSSTTNRGLRKLTWFAVWVRNRAS